MDETAYLSHNETLLNTLGWCLVPTYYSQLKQCQEQAPLEQRVQFRYLAAQVENFPHPSEKQIAEYFSIIEAAGYDMKTQPMDVNEWMYLGTEKPESFLGTILRSVWTLLGYKW
ncbi:hypothetical protein NCS56_01546300 [Fusarium sp. Ph1]|nr:hypothetical protein NCS56_01546300 [Fusarium sp. Ph1]